MTLRVTVLGCGGSGGVPMIGDDWGACDPANPKNRRLRPSILVEDEATRVLVDTSPDLRAQLLAAGVGTLDGVLYTHDHADHLHGIDDLRRVNAIKNAPLDVYGDRGTLYTLATRFPYVIDPPTPGAGYYKPHLIPHEITGAFELGSLSVAPFAQDHGFGRTTLGFRFGSLAYSTDLCGLPKESLAALESLDVWIVDCLQFEPHPTHAHLDKALDWIERLRPRRAVLTHMNNRTDYAALRARLPPHVEPAYDGMVITL